MTLTFLSLGKIAPWDALFYMGAQFCGRTGRASRFPRRWSIGAPSLTRRSIMQSPCPGTAGAWVAFAAEFAISFLMVTLS